jgi:hypothetical protein
MYAIQQKKDAPNQRCNICGYEWCTNSKLKYVCCPSCRRGILRQPFNIENNNKGKSVQPSKNRPKEAARIEATSTQEADIGHHKY